MSYDLNLQNPGEGPDEDFNITFNVGYIFYAVYKETGIRAIYNLSGKESVKALRIIREYMEDNWKELVDNQPENGWGTVLTTHKCINKMIQVAVINPTWIWTGD